MYSAESSAISNELIITNRKTPYAGTIHMVFIVVAILTFETLGFFMIKKKKIPGNKRSVDSLAISATNNNPEKSHQR